MKLYELSKDSLFTIDDASDKAVLTFHHVDGMYSFCTDAQKEVVHIKAWTEVTRLE